MSDIVEGTLKYSYHNGTESDTLTTNGRQSLVVRMTFRPRVGQRNRGTSLVNEESFRLKKVLLVHVLVCVCSLYIHFRLG